MTPPMRDLAGALLLIVAGLFSSTPLAKDGTSKPGTPTTIPDAAYKEKQDARCLQLERDMEQEQSQEGFGPKAWGAIRTCMPATYRGFAIMAQMTLGRLGYATGPFDGVLDERIKRAIGAYQKNSGLQVTGDLDNRTMNKLSDDGNTLDALPVNLSGYFFYDQNWSSFVSAQGTFVIENEKQGIPIQTSKVECWRQWNTCVEATAMVMPGTTKLLSIDMTYHDIERWDEHEIVTKPVDAVCARTTMRISRDQKLVTQLRSRISQEGTCKGFEAEDLHIRLEDGFKVWKQLNDDQTKSTKKIMLADWGALDRAFRENDSKRIGDGGTPTRP